MPIFAINLTAIKIMAIKIIRNEILRQTNRIEIAQAD